MKAEAPDRALAVLRVATGVLMALVFLLTNVRLLLTRSFVIAEYASPGFPEDRYGFTREQRIEYAGWSLEYLLNDADVSFLAQRAGPEGSALLNERELRHMVDVKQLVQAALRAWGIFGILLGIALVATYRWEGKGGVRRTLHFGGRLTLFLMAALIAVLLVSFSFLFVGFHRIFFEGGTWVFYHSDTLIRLFPERFWRDAFGLLLILTLVEAGLTIFLTRPSARARPS